MNKPEQIGVVILQYPSGAYLTNASGDWWKWENNVWQRSSDPNTPQPPSYFYSANGHCTWDWAAPYARDNWARSIQDLKDLGVTAYRNGFSCYYDDHGTICDSDLAAFQDFIENFAEPAGIQVHPVALPSISYNSESEGYDAGFEFGKQIGALGSSVPHIETANEIEASVLKGGQYNGIDPDHYDSQRFAVARGVLTGMKDGIRNSGFTGKLAMPGGCWLHTGFYDMLIQGTDPDGNSGCHKLEWDITPWHWYTSNYPPSDNPENSQDNFNLLQHLASYGKPIHINEFGANWDAYESEEQVCRAIIDLYEQFWSKREQYGIENLAYYQLYDWTGGDQPPDPACREMNFGVIESDGCTRKPRFSDVQCFIQRCPATTI